MPDVLGLNYNLKKYDDPHLIKNDLDFIESRSYLGGSCIWCFHDYGTEYKPVWPILGGRKI
ncbi:MAG: hypothetical protein GWP06_04750 [Actinobacteria bacterium]|nr:hypothetical protein [Actinomycetota bacterium]